MRGKSKNALLLFFLALSFSGSSKSFGSGFSLAEGIVSSQQETTVQITFGENDPFAGLGDSIDRIRESTSRVENTPSIHDLLDGNSNVLNITQRISSREVETTKFQHY